MDNQAMLTIRLSLDIPDDEILDSVSITSGSKDLRLDRVTHARFVSIVREIKQDLSATLKNRDFSQCGARLWAQLNLLRNLNDKSCSSQNSIELLSVIDWLNAIIISLDELAETQQAIQKGDDNAA